MKKSVRLLAFLLAALMCVGMLAACGGTEDPAESTKGPANTSAQTPTTTQTPAGTQTPGVTTQTPATSQTPAGTQTPGLTTQTPGPTTQPPATSQAPVSTEPADPLAKWEPLDFSDVTLRIAYNDVVSKQVTDTGAGNSLVYLRGPDDVTGTTRGDYKAAYERHERVLAALNLTPGVNFEYIMADWDSNCDSILPKIQSYNTANLDDAPNIVIHQNYGMVRAGILGELYNALDTEEENYFDLNHKNWYRGMMEINSIDTSKIYMLMGDYFIDQLRFAFGILVNSEMADEILALEGGLDHIYDLVDNGEWTYDQMMSIAELAYEGSTGENLVMGVVSDQWVVRNFLAASGLDIFKRDATGSSYYIQGEEINPIHDWVDKIISMEREDYFSYNWGKDPQNTSKQSPVTTFINGGALFALNQMILTLEGSQVQSMSSPAGMLPNPKYMPLGDDFNDFKTDYRSLVSDNANAGGILISSSSRQFTAASAFIQAMTENSDEFFEEYFVLGLQHKNNDLGPRHVDMLDYIHAGICSPMSFLYDNYCAKSINLKTYGAMIYPSIDGLSNTFSSDWDHEVGAKAERWEAIKRDFGIRQEVGSN